MIRPEFMSTFLHLSAKAFSIYWSLTTRIRIQCLVICIDFPRREKCVYAQCEWKRKFPARSQTNNLINYD